MVLKTTLFVATNNNEKEGQSLSVGSLTSSSDEREIVSGIDNALYSNTVVTEPGKNVPFCYC